MFFSAIYNCFKKFGKMKRNSFDSNFHKAESYLRLNGLTTSIKLNGSDIRKY